MSNVLTIIFKNTKPFLPPIAAKVPLQANLAQAKMVLEDCVCQKEVVAMKLAFWPDHEWIFFKGIFIRVFLVAGHGNPSQKC